MACYFGNCAVNRLLTFNLCLWIIVFTLCGCTDLHSEMRSITWDPLPLSLSNCPDISGTYKDQNSSVLIAYGQKPSLYSLFPRASFPHEKRQEIKGQLNPWAKNIFQRKYQPSDLFYSKALTKLSKKKPTELQFGLMDERAILYREKTLSLEQPGVGCYEGTLIIRTIEIATGAESSGGSAYARETKFKKLENGDLSVELNKRRWYIMVLLLVYQLILTLILAII